MGPPDIGENFERDVGYCLFAALAVAGGIGIGVGVLAYHWFFAK